MKKIVFITPLFVTALALPIMMRAPKAEIKPAEAVSVSGCNQVSIPTKQTINLNPVADADVRSYYSSLNSLPESELKGTNLLKNLKPILYNMNYYTYDAVWKVYEITDRNWTLSPASGTTYGTYDPSTGIITDYEYGSSSTNRKNDPYVRTLYRETAGGKDLIKEWDSHDTGTNREHVWCQSRGFKATSGAKGPAGTDIHHLISGDAYVNKSVHNNTPYGYVLTPSGQGNLESTANNKVGTALYQSSQDESSGHKAFEPADEFKGDIARAIFYMAARYNNYAGASTLKPTLFEANLTLANYLTSDGDHEDSSPTHAVAMGKLSDLLEWNVIDPVDEYEIHRNDLIYRNYQGNRNPFIDFPEWAEVIWGTGKEGEVLSPDPSKKANPQTDKLHVYNPAPLQVSTTNAMVNLVTDTSVPGGKTAITAVTSDSSQITWSFVGSNDCVQLSKTTTNSGEPVLLTGLKYGTATLKASATVEGEDLSTNISLTADKVTSLTLTGYKSEFYVGDVFKAQDLVVTANYEHGRTVVVPAGEYTYNDIDTSTVGELIVNVRYGGQIASYRINIVNKPEEAKMPVWMIVVIAGGVVLIAVVLIIIFVNSSKKNKRKMKSGAKKIIKSVTKSSSKKSSKSKK